MRKFYAFVTATVMSLGLTAAQAATIPNLANTGAGLSAGAADTNWAISNTLGGTQSDAVVIQNNIPGTWLDNDATSRWIWETSNGQPVNVARFFTTTFDLTGLNASTASITGRWSADNKGNDIFINGVSTGQETTSGFVDWTDFAINSGFVSGINTLTFKVTDVGSIAGFRAEIQSATAAAVPLPAGALFLLTGLGGLAAFRVRGRAKA